MYTFRDEWIHNNKVVPRMLIDVMLIKPVLQIHKDRHDSRSWHIIFHIFYNVTYYIDPDTSKFSRFKGLKFVPWLISMWGIRKCHHFNPKLPTLAIASSFTAYLIYVLYGAQNGKIKQIEAIKFVPRLILKRGIRKVSILTLNYLSSPLRIVSPNISFTYYMDPKRQN